MLKFKYGIKYEVDRVARTIEKIDWFNKKGYRVLLPNNLVGLNEAAISLIEKEVNNEFREGEYDVIAQEAQSYFMKIEEDFLTRLQAIFGKDIPRDYEVILTKYGVGGSYHPPRTIVINFKQNFSLYNTLVHEIVHLCLQKYINKYEISHWVKERVVDLILNSEGFKFLDYDSWQGNYRGCEKYVDSLFGKYFYKSKKKFFEELQKYNKHEK